MKYLLSLLLAFTLVTANARAADVPVTFEGTVEDGKPFVHDATDGYSFVLLPQKEGGWKITLTNKDRIVCPSEDYDCNDMASMTLPFVNSPRDITGWQFTKEAYMYNQANNVKSPLVHKFFYVNNRRDLDAVMKTYDCRNMKGKQSCPNIGTIQVRKGLLKISEYKPVLAGKSLVLAMVKFSVTIYPAAALSTYEANHHAASANPVKK